MQRPNVSASTPRAGLGLQRRLLWLLLLPLLVVGLLNTWLDYRLADSAAIQQDRQLLTLVPQLAASIQATAADVSPDLHLSLELREFLTSRGPAAAYAVLNEEGHVLLGEEWLRDYPPDTREPEFSSQEVRGVVYRIVTQRVVTPAGELTVRLADGASLSWQRLHRFALKVLLPNVLLVVLAYVALQWAVRRALRPLLQLKDQVEGRSPRDLSPLDEAVTPDEVRPLVRSLNHLFALVNDQAASQRHFIADAAHQLRTPLAALQAQVEAMAQRPLAEQADAILRLRDATRRTSQLVQQVLTLSRVEAPGMLVPPDARVDLKILCEDVLELHWENAARRHIAFGLEVVPAMARGDGWLLRELLSNLVDNAIRYTPAGGTVTLQCGRWGADATAGPERLFLAVVDDGPGVPPAERARILQRFYRVAGSQGEGSGLGLAIAEEIARAHGSQLVVEAPTSGRGLLVRLLLDAVRESAPPMLQRP